MALSGTELKLIELRNTTTKTLNEIAEELGLTFFQVRARIDRLRIQGHIRSRKSGKKRKDFMLISIEHAVTVRSPKPMKCSCEYPSCNFNAVYTFALVPLCLNHYDVIKEETDLYYSVEEEHRKLSRKHWDKISKRSAELWANQKASTFIQTKSNQSAKESAAEQKEHHITLKATNPSWLTF